MPDRENVIAWLADEELYYREHGDTHNSLMACDALAILKDEKEYCDKCAKSAIKTTVELQEEIARLRSLLKEQEAVVRCKDCKHRPKKPDWLTFEDGSDIEFPENSKCPCQNINDRYYSWYPEDDWFCADGEPKEGR